jgi:hypothetical protein
MPGTDKDTSFANVIPKNGFLLRAHKQVIIEHDGLSIKHEVLEILVLVEEVKQTIHEMNESQPEHLKRLIPFAVPMCM